VRLARYGPVFYIEELVEIAAGEAPSLRVSAHPADGVQVPTPLLAAGSGEASRHSVLRALLDDLTAHHELCADALVLHADDARVFSQRVDAACIVYDGRATAFRYSFRKRGPRGRAARRGLRHVCAEVEVAERQGVPVHGICIYPVMDYPAWVDDRQCRPGLIQRPMDGRVVCPEMRRTLGDMQELFEPYARVASFRSALPG
jgi:hypothetical protein